MFHDNWFDNLLMIAGLGCSYLVGKENGKKEAFQIQYQRDREKEILELRQEIERLKKGQI